MYSGFGWNMAKPPGCVVLTMICLFGGVHAAGAEFYYNLKATDTPQIITSPGYPLKYAPNVSYTRHIRAADPSQVVVLETLDSMVHISYDCRADTVAVFKGASSQTARRVRKWCGNLRYYFDASSSYFLYFRTDSKFENRGFQVRYYQGPMTCPASIAFRHNSRLTGYR
ncbi:neuropilin-1-like [Haliotis rufescens]|uniref:neuropilin-1-like n=1 Tax=Haliotis rufescens TaxID=6454 RepID=UPI00201F43A4|nr:neuropilin-1-like [Haliotis rufescens]